MPLNPEYQALLDQMAQLEGPPLVDLPVEAGRQMYRTMQPEAPEIEVGTVLDTDADGVPVRVYQPVGEGPFPVVMMFHGGGWVIGDLTTADGQSREVCRQAEAVVISVDYRLAPEHRFPAAADDCYAATLWAAQSAHRYRGDPSRLALAGDSAGGNLAAVVAQMIRDKGGPAVAFQLLVYPVTDGVNFDTPSYHENGQDYMLTAESMHWFWNHYAPNAEDRQNPYASPLLAENLADLPAALVMTAEYDPLRDEGEAYAEKLAKAGVEVEVVRCDGLIHGFFGQARTVQAAVKPMARACKALKAALS